MFLFKKRMNKIEVVHEILDKIEMPTGEEEYIFPKYKKGKELKNFLDHKKRGYVAGLEHSQDTSLGQLITKEVFGKNGNRYAHLPLQSSCDRTHSDNNFWKMMEDYLIWNREVILQEGKIIPDPIVVEKDNELIYDGETIEAEINEDDIFDTLIKAGLFKEPKEDVYKGNIYFGDGVSAVGSSWFVVGRCFVAVGNGPSGRGSDSLAAFEKTGKMPELEN